MKKIYLLVSGLCLVAGSVTAQTTERGVTSEEYKQFVNPTDGDFSFRGLPEMVGERAADDILWSENFDTPENWLFEGPAGSVAPDYGWSVGTTTLGWFFGTGFDMGTDGNFVRFSNGGTEAPDAPIEDGPFTFTLDSTLDLTGAPSLFLEWSQYGARFWTSQKIQLSFNGGTDWVDAASNDDIEPLTAAGGSVYAQPQRRRFNISSVVPDGEGDEVMIRLFWDRANLPNDGALNAIEYGWYVDDIAIIEGHQYDSEIQQGFLRAGLDEETFPEGLEYYQIPQHQAENAEFVFSAITINQGWDDFSDLQFDVDVVRGATTVYSASSSTIAAESGSRDSLGTDPAAGFSPTELGPHTVTYSFSATEEDTYTSNDELTEQFRVTETTYARHNGNEQSGISNFADNTGSFSIGNVMLAHANGGITEVSFKLTDDDGQVGAILFAQLWKFDEGTGNYLYADQTPDYTVVASDVDDWITLAFENPVIVNEGELFLPMASMYEGGAATIATAQETVFPSVVGLSSDGSLGNLLEPSCVMIEVTHLSETMLGVEENANANFSISQNIPNPFGSNAAINYALNKASNVSIEIVDMTGKVVKSINNGSQAAGAYTLDLDGADFADGVYFYTFTVGAEQVTKRMVVSK